MEKNRLGRIMGIIKELYDIVGPREIGNILRKIREEKERLTREYEEEQCKK